VYDATATEEAHTAVAPALLLCLVHDGEHLSRIVEHEQREGRGLVGIAAVVG
jgi:hypothetical protein